MRNHCFKISVLTLVILVPKSSQLNHHPRKKKPQSPILQLWKRPKILSEFPFSGKTFIVHYIYSYPMLTKPLEKLRKHLLSNQTLATTWIELARMGEGHPFLHPQEIVLNPQIQCLNPNNVFNVKMKASFSFFLFFAHHHIATHWNILLFSSLYPLCRTWKMQHAHTPARRSMK